MINADLLLEWLGPKVPWTEHALCRGADPDLFFPTRHSDSDSEGAAAKAVCAECPVAVDCLEYALANNEKYGIWGGMTVRERASFLRKRRRQRANDERRAQFEAAS